MKKVLAICILYSIIYANNTLAYELKDYTKVLSIANINKSKFTSNRSISKNTYAYKNLFSNIFTYKIFNIIFPHFSDSNINKTRFVEISSNNKFFQKTIYSTEILSTNYKNLTNKTIIFEGTVGDFCCSQREIPLVSISSFINKNGNVTTVKLEFKKNELNIVRNYSTDMRIKVTGKIRKVEKELLAYSDYGISIYETKIYIYDCKLVN